ncbi:glycoside hydrolase family 88 protein [Telluria beijingensis]|uniref:glycoside hydrolase family 88/105 protein n=1 Tax=Telluria beijingensis TaxID=3068633 RepID=UPI002795CAFE|nr:glycoside hydrolase family 88 protein [Massilia sp. REN29]
MTFTRRRYLKTMLAGVPVLAGCTTMLPGAAGFQPLPTRAQALDALARANDYWQAHNPPTHWAFWDYAAYHTGNMAAFDVTRRQDWLRYSTAWAEHNLWMGAKEPDQRKWKYSYGETDEYVLFGDWQICFQTYIDLYRTDGSRDPGKIARALEVMRHQVETPNLDYWWWADGLYMVMPVMTKLYRLTGERRYLDKLVDYFTWADKLIFDQQAGLYYRDGRYVYPKHKSANGGKDFWSRGDGWVFAGLAKVLADLPHDHASRPLFLDRYRRMAAALKKAQQEEGYWARSLLDPGFAPGRETSGTAFFTYGYLWGMNHGLLDKAEYTPVVARSWRYLSTIALQADGKVGYVQPIGDRAIPGQHIGRDATTPFGVGAFLLAAAEMSRFAAA